jgi:cyclic pyranopterin phosphate synthase
MPEGEPERMGERLSAAECVEIVRQAASLGVDKVRLTGGEPLLRRRHFDICRGIAGIEGIRTLC